MDYWELRTLVSKLIPRLSVFIEQKEKQSLVKEKGRKTNYYQFAIDKGEMIKKERLLNLEEMQSFIEVSLRSQACPMSLNLDIYDSKLCPYRCKYCVTGDTLIDTPKGKISIKDLQVGDSVFTMNEFNHNIEVKPIKQTMKRKSKVYRLEIGGDMLLITGEHPVFTKRGWVKVEDLKTGDEVLTVE